MKRRGLLGAILASAVAPAYVGSTVLMPVRKIIVPPIPSLFDPDSFALDTDYVHPTRAAMEVMGLMAFGFQPTKQEHRAIHTFVREHQWPDKRAAGGGGER